MRIMKQMPKEYGVHNGHCIQNKQQMYLVQEKQQQSKLNCTFLFT